MVDPPIYIEVAPETIVNELVQWYENETGNTLQPAQVERLIIGAWAYRESLLRSQVQSAAIMNLVSFSSEPVLDYLGELVGVVRNDAQNALVDITFTLVAGHGGVTIPSGTRVASTDGLAVFATQQDVIVPSVDLTATTTCVSATSGANFNGYAIGTITSILDPQAYLASATNINISGGGSNRETDEQLKNRIRLAPDAFGTAGSQRAYMYWAFTANPAIIDVSVPLVPAIAGEVRVYPLMEDGSITPTVVLNQVTGVINGEYVRPLTDTVVVQAPTQVTYTLAIDVTIFDNADPTTVQAACLASLEAYVLQQRQRMGRDIMVDQVTAAAMVDGVYDIDLGGFTDLVIADNEYGFCTGITVTIIGTNEG
jgi:phage-related baseplate assembly protein